MKTALRFIILTLFVVSGIASATEQVPDILYSDGLKLRLGTGWGHPSPLETYYYENRLAYPFEGFSTANYRGHVATWEIVDGRLYLTDIQTERYEPNETDPKSFEFVVESYEPNEYGVKARSGPPSEDGDVLADWFNGVLDCYLISEGNYYSYLYHVQDGNVVDTQIITSQDYKILYSSPVAGMLTEDMRKKYDMLVLNENYITYYFRLIENDAIEYKGEDCYLDTGWSRLSPLFGRYDNNHLNWPYNWENREKCGAPHCQWLIRDDRLYLARVQLYSGLLFDRIDTEVLELETLFPGEVIAGEVPANWVSGVYLIQHGDAAEFRGPFDCTYVRIREGALIESYTVPSDFDTQNMPADTDPGLRQIIEDYELPSAVER